MELDIENQVAEWKKKYEASEKNLDTLKILAHKAVFDYEDLLRKYDQNQKQYEEIKLRLEDREQQLKKLQTVLEPVYDEYSQLETKYEIEKGCRSKAEEYATKIVAENKKLNRQSRYLMDHMNTNNVNVLDINFEELDAVESDFSEDQSTHLQSMIEELQTEVAQLKQKARNAEEERDIALEREKQTKEQYEQEKDALKRARSNLEHTEVQLHNFKRVSLKAYEEFGNLREKYVKEKTLKDEAEKYASKMLSERNIMKRQSAILIDNAMNDAKLANSLLKIEELTNEVESQKVLIALKEKEIQENLELYQQEQGVNELENNVYAEQLSDVQKQLSEACEDVKRLSKENDQLRRSLNIAEERLRPPIPPPPPPPPPAGGLLKPLKNLIKKNKQSSVDKLKETVKKQDPKYGEAIEEMMERIKSGTALRGTPKRRPELDLSLWKKPSVEDDSAMQELHSILSTVKKRSHSAPNVMNAAASIDGGDEMADNDFLRTFNKITGNNRAPTLNRNLSLIAEEKDSVSPKSSDDQNVTKM